MGGVLRFGMAPDQNLPFEELVERWRYYESLGLDGLWVCDHFNQPSRPTGPYFEDVVGGYREVGVNEFILDQPTPEQFPALERIATEIMPGLHAG